jgi:hypothetical protein
METYIKIQYLADAIELLAVNSVINNEVIDELIEQNAQLTKICDMQVSILERLLDENK